MQRILLYPAGIPQREAFIEARSMNYYIVTVDCNPSAACFELADESFVINPDDEKVFTNFVKQYHSQKPFTGILLVGSDLPVSVAKVSKIIGCRGPSIEAAALTTNKLASKEMFASFGIPIPQFAKAGNSDDVKRMLRDHNGRMIIKPNDNCGSRGILQLDADSNLEAAFEYAQKNVKHDGVILEVFEPGLQISIEGLACDGRVFVAGFADRNYEYLDRFFPHVLENGATMPTELTTEQRKEVEDVFIRAVHALGITNCIVKGDMIYGPQGAKVIEVAARISGGKFASKLIPESTGINLLVVALRHAMGEPLNESLLTPSLTRGVAVRYFFPPEGKLKKIKGLKHATEIPGVLELITTYQPGDYIPKIENHTHRAGWVVAVSETRDEAVCIAEKAVENIVFEVEQ